MLEWQLNLLQWLQQFKSPLLDGFFIAVTMSAEETVYILIAAVGLWCVNKPLTQRGGLIFLTSTVLNPVLKSSFAIERPIGHGGLESLRVHTAEGYAFPSGHSQGAASFWFALLWLFRKPWLVGVCLTLIFLVAISRLYLAVHWPVDVIAGVGFGIVWVLIANAYMQWADSTGNKLLPWLLVLPFFIGYFLFPENKPLVVSLGSCIGFLAGMQLENKYLNYQTEGRLWQHLLKYVLGLAVLVLLKVGLKSLLAFDAHIADLIRYSIIGFWLSFAAPFMFCQLGLMKKNNP